MEIKAQQTKKNASNENSETENRRDLMGLNLNM